MVRISKRQAYLAAGRIAEKMGRTFMEYDPKTYNLRAGTVMLKPAFAGKFELIIKGTQGRERHPFSMLFSARDIWDIDRFMRDFEFAKPKRKMKKFSSSRIDREGKVIYSSR